VWGGQAVGIGKYLSKEQLSWVQEGTIKGKMGVGAWLVQLSEFNENVHRYCQSERSISTVVSYFVMGSALVSILLTVGWFYTQKEILFIPIFALFVVAILVWLWSQSRAKSLLIAYPLHKLTFIWSRADIKLARELRKKGESSRMKRNDSIKLTSLLTNQLSRQLVALLTKLEPEIPPQALITIDYIPYFEVPHNVHLAEIFAIDGGWLTLEIPLLHDNILTVKISDKMDSKLGFWKETRTIYKKRRSKTKTIKNEITIYTVKRTCDVQLLASPKKNTLLPPPTSTKPSFKITTQTGKKLQVNVRCTQGKKYTTTEPLTRAPTPEQQAENLGKQLQPYEITIIMAAQHAFRYLQPKSLHH
jgi:hypothetical protein